jgi:glycosyltransferase involved in cell wall biosynthesis
MGVVIMKILHIQQYFNENMGYQENILPYYQKNLGHEVVLITSTRSDGFNNENRVKEASEFVENGFKVKRINIRGEFKKRFVIFDNLYEFIEDEKPDYIYHHSVTSPSLKTVCDYKKNNPHVFIAVDNHADLNISGRNKLWKVFYYNIFWKSVIKKYDKFINVYFGVTPTRCLFLEEELGVNSNKIRLLPIGADVNNAQVTTTKEEIFNKYNLDKDSIIIIHGGKITPEKQINKIIEAFKRIKNENIRLVLFGSINDKYVESLVKSDNRIVYIGWLNREDTLAMLKYSDVGIWNTQHTTLLEDCVAVGLPMILRYYGSTCHLIDNTGLFLYDGSVREIQDKLSLIINNKELVDKFRSNSSSLRDLLSYAKVAEESIKYYQNEYYGDIHINLMNERVSDISYRSFRLFKNTHG